MVDDIVKEFLVESYENLDQLDRDLMALEETPDDKSRLSSVFRTIHTIKGTSGFLAYPHLEHIAHVGENLLVKLRDGVLRLNAEMASALLEMVDAIRSILGKIDSTGTEGDEAYEALAIKLERLKSGESVPVIIAPATKPAVVPAAQAAPVVSEQMEIEVEQVVRELNQETAAAVESAPGKRKRGRPKGSTGKAVKSAAPCKDSRRVGDSNLSISADSSENQGTDVLRSPEDLQQTMPLPATELAAAQTQTAHSAPVDPQQTGTQTHEEASPVVAAKPVKKPVAEADASSENADRNNSAADSTVRIDVNVLDRLMNLVGELVLARNQIMQFSQSMEDAALVAASQRLNLITTELQEGVMKTRMQPIRNAWSKLPRVVRDLSISCGKQVQVEMEGAETELDKTILEAIRDPLTHIVRNSVDHGIEPADVRVKAGKPAQGTLWLRAYHEGGQVNIEIADDGAGISVDRVRQKAVEKGLVTPEQAAAMSDREAIQMILLPGFSTAAKVTNVSGRGVGMDVVKTNVEKIGGTLEIHSVVGSGTTLRIKIPLTLAIIPALIVTTSGDRYAIPQVSLLELVRLEGEQVRQSIEYVHGAPVYRLRGKLLPLVYLNQALGTAGEERSAQCSHGEHKCGGAWNLDFMMARSKHLAWKGRLRAYLDGKESMKLEEAVSPRFCSLGQWLYSDGLRDFGHLPRVKELEKLHAEMHAAVGRVIQKNEQGDKEGAEKLLKDVDAYSHQTVAILDELKETAEGAGAINIVVLRANDRQYGLVVDKVNDSAEIVVKPLSRQLKGLSEYAGTTIMGDGTVALILDVMGLAIGAGLTAEMKDQQHAANMKDASHSGHETQTLLVVDLGDTRRFALPTSMVARLEKVPRTSVEQTDGHEVIQYRGEIMPIVRLANIFGAANYGEAEPDELQIIVYSESDYSCGFAVNRIVDIVETELKLQHQQNGHSENLLGTTVIQDRVTDVLNLCSLARH
ncbi:MAG: chemotaxis protein CheW [Planctomycetaceae bacterium]